MASKPSFAGQALGLFTDMLVGIRAELKTLGGNDDHLEKLREPRFFEIAAAYAMGKVITISEATQAVVESMLQSLDRTVAVTMDLSRTVERMIADGRYNSVNSEIVKLLKSTPGAGIKPLEILLLHYGKDMTSESVLAGMEREGLRPATFLELLWIGIQHSLLQLEFPIIALGSVVKSSGGRCVAYLSHGGAERFLDLGRFVGGWHGGCRFAAVRLPSQVGK